MNVRTATDAELDRLASLWHDTWHEAHAPLVPAALTRLRTTENFRLRLEQALSDVRVVGPVGEPIGLCMIRDAELYQLFVSASTRGSGTAVALIADAEARLAARGVDVAYLACAIGNARAARFYEKQGWSRVGTMVTVAETSEGTFELETWRYEKRVTPARR
jgi:ribosomal protein S18 acetylase RimI-like enzyme